MLRILFRIYLTKIILKRFSQSGLARSALLRKIYFTSSIREPLGKIETWMLANGVVIAVVNHPKFSHGLSPNGGLNGPIMRVAGLHLPLQHSHVNDLGTQAVQDDANVLDGQVGRLFKGQLINQQQELVRRPRLVIVVRLRLRALLVHGVGLRGLSRGRGGHLGRHGGGLDDGAAGDATVAVGGSLIVGSSGGGSAVA